MGSSQVVIQLPSETLNPTELGRSWVDSREPPSNPTFRGVSREAQGRAQGRQMTCRNRAMTHGCSALRLDALPRKPAKRQPRGSQEACFTSDSPESVNSKGSSGYTDKQREPSRQRSRTKRSAGYIWHITARAAAGSSPHDLRVGFEGDEEGSPTPLLFCPSPGA